MPKVALASLGFTIALMLGQGSSAAASTAPCPASHARLFVAINAGNDRHLNMYCMGETKPPLAIAAGIESLIEGPIRHDSLGNVYVPDSSYQLGGLGGLLVYGPDGALKGRVAGLENVGAPIIDPTTNQAFVLTPHYEGPDVRNWKTPTGWVPYLSVLGGRPGKVLRRLAFVGTPDPRFVLADGMGHFYYWNNNDGRVYEASESSGTILRSVWAPAGDMVLGVDGLLYVNSYGKINIFRASDLKFLRSFHDGSVHRRDFGPMAIAADGTLYVSHVNSGTVEAFAPNSSKRLTKIGNVANIDAIALDEVGNVYVEVPFATAGRAPGIYVFAPHSSKLKRAFPAPNGSRTLYGMTVVPGRAERH